MSSAKSGERIAVGIIRKAHGVRGEASIEPWTDSADRFEELEVDPEDLGKVIGRQGRTARAIRNLLSAAGQKTRRRYSLDILD